MNASLRWLRDLAPDIDRSPAALSDRLAELGFPVDGIDALADELGDIVVARVVEAGQHPNADRLSLCQVDAGTGELLSVVCGAPNVRAGALFPFIPVGGTLPGGMQIRKAKLRGETSNGMLCSARELGLGTDHSGLLELRGDYTPGTPFVEVFGLGGDARLDVEVTSNRGDLLSHVGLARELAASGQAGVALPEFPGAAEPLTVQWKESASSLTLEGLTLEIDEPELCSRLTGAVIRGVKVGPSPDWLQARLRSVGARPINNVVDATNYVLFELGQPTHAYDLSTLKGGRIVARRAHSAETIRTLDEQDRTLDEEMLVIADDERAVNVAGIMGDEHSSVTEQTTDVFVECAWFAPASIRRTRKLLGISSDAGYRFERWVDPTGQRAALERVVHLIVTVAGGTAHPEFADLHVQPWHAPTLLLRSARVKHVLGVAFSEPEMRGLLEPLGFVCSDAGGTKGLHVEVPGWRGYDVTREVDLIEEIARRHGYERFPEALGAYRPTQVPDHPRFALEDDLRQLMARRGFFEAQTPAFVPEAEGDVVLSNPLSSEEPVLRRTLTPSLLRRLERNLARGVRDVRLFEVGTSFRAVSPGERPLEHSHLAVVFTGRARPAHFAAQASPLDIWDAKQLMGDIAGRVDPSWTIVPATGEVVHKALALPIQPGFALVIKDGEGNVAGFGGRVDAKAVDAPPWAGEIFALEVTLPDEPMPPAVPLFEGVPSHPAMERDLALLVPTTVQAGQIESLARAEAGEHLVAVIPFDLYEGKGLEPGVRSIAWRFRFQAHERTLTDDEVERALNNVVRRLNEELGVRIRA